MMAEKPKNPVLTDSEFREAWGLIQLEFQWITDSRVTLVCRAFDELRMFRKMHGVGDGLGRNDQKTDGDA